MNIIKTTGVGVILIMFCSVCSEPGDPPIIKTTYKTLNVVAEVSATDVPVKIAENYQIELFGNTTSCSLSESGAPCITVSGIIVQPDYDGNFDFVGGEFLLKSTATGCELWGQFNGKGTIEENQITIESDVEVNCGTGVFVSKGGDLTMTITGQLPTENSESPTYLLLLDGLLEI